MKTPQQIEKRRKLNLYKRTSPRYKARRLELYQEKVKAKLDASRKKPRNIVFPDGVEYEKPFTEIPRGFGYFGVVLVDKDTGELQCHQCGAWTETLSVHAYTSHKIKAELYREQYGLLQNTALISERIREILIEHGKEVARRYKLDSKAAIERLKSFQNNNEKKRRHSYANAERMNKKGTCPVQVLDKLIKISEKLGRQPYKKEMKDDLGRSIVDAAKRRYGNLAEVRRILEMQGYTYKLPAKATYTNEEMLGHLRKFESIYGRKPSPSDFRRELLPLSYGSYYARFGPIHKVSL